MTKPEHSYNGGRGKEIDVHVIPCDSWLFYSREANLFQTQTDSFNFIFGFLFTPVSTQCTECYLHTCPFSAHCQPLFKLLLGVCNIHISLCEHTSNSVPCYEDISD